MAKFDKNIKNEFLDQDIFDDEYFIFFHDYMSLSLNI